MAKEENPPAGIAETKLPSRAEEARNLAQEAAEELKHGNKEESEFLLAEAKNLDPAAVKDARVSTERGKL